MKLNCVWLPYTIHHAILWHDVDVNWWLRFWERNAYTCVNLHNNMNFWLWNLIPDDLFRAHFSISFIICWSNAKRKSSCSGSFNGIHASASVANLFVLVHAMQHCLSPIFFRPMFPLDHWIAHGASMKIVSAKIDFSHGRSFRADNQKSVQTHPYAGLRLQFTFLNPMRNPSRLFDTSIAVMRRFSLAKYNEQQREVQKKPEQQWTILIFSFIIISNFDLEMHYSVGWKQNKKIFIEKQQAIDGSGVVRDLMRTIPVNRSSLNLLITCLPEFGCRFYDK